MHHLLAGALGVASPGGRRARLVILTYHRVLPAPDPLLPDEPDRDQFQRQMMTLARLANVLPLPDAAQRLRDGTLPARAACITFDDGYRNNLDVAAPVLRNLGLPATIFVAQHAVERGIMWNDLLIEAVRVAPDGGASAVPEFVEPLADSSARCALISSLLRSQKYRSLPDRWQFAMETYQAIAGKEPPRLMMAQEDVATLPRLGFDVGGHTVNHPILTTLAPQKARDEIVRNADWLATLTGLRPRSFAYPNGRPGRDFNATHEQMARETGYEVAVSTEWGAARTGSNVYSLPRIGLSETSSVAIFSRLLKTCLR